MPPRTYHQLCAVAKALDLVGQRWTLLIVRDLMPGPLNYTGLLEGLPGLTTNLLAKRLKELSELGLVEKEDAAAGDRTKAQYRLTEAGKDLAPVLGALSQWGRKYGRPSAADDSLNFRWAFIMLGRQYVQTGGRWIVQLQVCDKSIQLRLGGPEFESVAGTGLRPDLILHGVGSSFFELFGGEATPEKLIADGRLRLQQGSAGEEVEPIWTDFLNSFQLQAPAVS
ncbi:MAG: helix-turn-helix transcriptional regulator [Planctomycetes bacterium]|nr:helix-turn-helix transcriptional regulator [Planctomycetota bacterium]